jgi:hypothetical protein
VLLALLYFYLNVLLKMMLIRTVEMVAIISDKTVKKKPDYIFPIFLVGILKAFMPTRIYWFSVFSFIKELYERDMLLLLDLYLERKNSARVLSEISHPFGNRDLLSDEMELNLPFAVFFLLGVLLWVL